MSQSDDDLFRGWRATPAPADLEERIMSAVRAGVLTPPKRLSDRLWESRSLRYWWAAAATALVALNLWLPTPTAGEPFRAAAVEESADFDPVLASLLDDRLSPKTTWADQGRLELILLGEARTIATEATADGGQS